MIMACRRQCITNSSSVAVWFVLSSLTAVLSTCCSTSWAKVSLNSSAVRVCRGDTLVFTCITEDTTGLLIWNTNGMHENAAFNKENQLNSTQTLGIFTLTLINVTGNTFVSTATVHNVSMEDNGTIITCSDSTMSQTRKLEVKTSNLLSVPLELFFTCSSLGFVNISWLSPLGTPLCVHSYTVTVRQSSQVVFYYKIVDNWIQLNLTELVIEDEYSVTVAGRDGAGQLGQESSRQFNIPVPQVAILGYDHYPSFVRIKWKLVEQLCYPLLHFLVTHNVSSDQSPITTNKTYVTLYGVRPGETYTVEVTPYVQSKRGEPKTFIFREFINCLLTTNITPTPSSNVCSNQLSQLWITVVLVLLVMFNPFTMIICCILIIMKVRPKLKTHKMTVKQQRYIVKTSSNNVESFYVNDDINAQRLTSIHDKDAEPHEHSRIYSEVRDTAMPISTKTNIAYNTVKQRAL